MAKVCLGDVANERKENCKTNEYSNHIVGLEHLIPQEVILTQWAENIETTFTKVFHKGDVLFGRRRAYLKKAAVAPFDGICSGDITVIEAKPNKIIPELLPFIIQNDNLFDYAVEKSAGSLSPRVKWSHLQNFEFELPDLDKQRELAELLWAAEETKRTYKNTIIITKKYLHIKFNEIFESDLFNKSSWDEYSISDIIHRPISGDWGKENKIKNSGVNVIRTTNFTDDGIIDYSDVVARDIDKNKIGEKELRFGDIIIEKSGGSDSKPVGRVVMYDKYDKNYICNNFTSVLRKKSDFIDNDFLFLFLFYSYHNGKTKLYDHKTTGIHNLKLQEYLDNTTIKIPPMEIQKQFLDLKKTSDKFMKSIEISKKTIKCFTNNVINQNLTKEVLHV